MRSPIRRLISFIVITNLKLFTLITHRPRARVLVLNEYDQVLLVLPHVTHSGRWTIPGGGLKRHERPEVAARRELHEETGVDADIAAFEYLATLERPAYDIPFTAPLFRVRIPKGALPKELHNPREIEKLGWFNRDALPEPLSLTVTTALELDRQRGRSVAA